MNWFRATAFEYRARYSIHALIYCAGILVAPWHDKWWLSIGRESVWVELAGGMMKGAGLSFATATWTVLGLATFFVCMAAWVRTWGAAYLGSGVVKDSSMHGESVLADGPYRYTRNPLYLGTILHTIGLSVLMQPLAALITIVLITLFQLRLILREEPFLAEQQGEAYLRYKAAVPRLVPSIQPGVVSGNAAPVWGQAVLGELYFIGVAASFLVLGWQWDSMLILRGVLIALGASIVARAFVK